MEARRKQDRGNEKREKLSEKNNAFDC